MKKIGIILVICSLLFLSGIFVQAGIIYISYKHFDNLNLGSLRGQDNWSTYPDTLSDLFQVQNEVVAKGTQAISYASTTIQESITKFDRLRRSVVSTSTLIATIFVRQDADLGRIFFGMQNTTDFNTPCAFVSTIDNVFLAKIADLESVLITTFNSNVWYLARVSFDLPNQKCRYQISSNDGQTWLADTDWISWNIDQPTNSVNRIDLRATGQGTYFDDILIWAETPQFSLFSLPMASTSDVIGNIGTLFSDLWVVIATAMGFPLGFFVIRRAIGLF